MTDNLPVQFQPQVLSAHMDYAKALAASDLLPAQYRGKPANLLWAISYGETLGVAPLTAVQSIHVINGRPTASADLIAGLVRRAGHKLRVNGDDKRAVAQIVRADDPDFTFEAVWTIERAQTARLVGKDTWKNFPAAMLKARAITEVARAACSEILQGTIYTPEELGARVDADGIPMEAEITQLHRVQPGEPDQWATPQPEAEFTPHAGAQALAKRAAAVQDRFIMGAVIDEAKRHVPADARILAPDTNEPDALREYLLRCWAALPKMPEKQEGEQPGGVIDAEVVDDVAAAEQQLRATAAKVGLDTLDADFEQSYGLPIAQAGVQQIAEMNQILSGAA